MDVKRTCVHCQILAARILKVSLRRFGTIYLMREIRPLAVVPLMYQHIDTRVQCCTVQEQRSTTRGRHSAVTPFLGNVGNGDVSCLS